MRPLLGAHVPTAGGLRLAPERAREIAAEAIQVFTRSHRQWRARSVEDEEAAAFREGVARSGVRIVLCHASYLPNLASPDHALLQKSRDALVAEMGLPDLSPSAVRPALLRRSDGPGPGDPGGLVRWKKELRLLRQLARPHRRPSRP